MIERAVVGTRGDVLQVPSLDPGVNGQVSSSRTLVQVERDHILATLHATNWVVGGWNGAAVQLGLSRTTLIARMQRLGLSKTSGTKGAPSIAPPPRESPGRVGSRRFAHVEAVFGHAAESA